MAHRLYVPLDVDYASDDKILAAGPMAELLYIRSLAFAKRTLSDGRISRAQLPLVALNVKGSATRHAADLVQVGLWEVCDGGWRIVAWERHNSSKAEVQAQAAIAKEAGERGNHERWHVEGGKPSHRCRLCVADRLASPDRVPDGPPESGSIAKPEPEPEPEPEPGITPCAVPALLDDEHTPDPVIEDLCRCLAGAVEAHRDGDRPRITAKWRTDMDLLLRRGPTDLDPAPVDPEKVRTAIRVVFTQLATPDSKSGFCWANQVRSPGALRDHWTQLRQAARVAQKPAMAKGMAGLQEFLEEVS
jgi:hypothetical protein